MLPLSMNPNPYCIGLDLDQSNDYTALAIVEKIRSGNPQRLAALHLRHLERYPLRTPYTEIANAVAALVKSENLVTHTTDEMLNTDHPFPGTSGRPDWRRAARDEVA